MSNIIKQLEQEQMKQEEVKKVETAIGASRAEQQREAML